MRKFGILQNAIAAVHANNVKAEEDAVRIEDTYFKEDGGAALLVDLPRRRGLGTYFRDRHAALEHRDR